MEKERYQDYLQRSGMDTAQANALSRILADMEARLVTKADLADAKSELKAHVAEVRAELKEDFTSIRKDFASLREEFALLRGDLRSDVASLESRLTWRFLGMFVAMTGFLAVVITVVGVFAR